MTLISIYFWAALILGGINLIRMAADAVKGEPVRQPTAGIRASAISLQILLVLFFVYVLFVRGLPATVAVAAG